MDGMKEEGERGEEKGMRSGRLGKVMKRRTGRDGECEWTRPSSGGNRRSWLVSSCSCNLTVKNVAC